MRISCAVAMAAFFCACSGGSAANDPGPPVDPPVDSGAPPEPSPGPPSLVAIGAQLTANELGLIINTDDPQSVAIGDAYIAKRKIPAANVVRLALGAPTGRNVTADTFATWKKQVDAALPETVQALAISFTQPSIVENCQSITAAFTFGYDTKYCVGCDVAPTSAYYSTPTAKPFTKLGIRPSMMLAASSVEEGTKLILRGVAADGTFPAGDGYFFRTDDATRSEPRISGFVATVKQFDAATLKVSYVDQTTGGAANLTNTKDVLFYMTGRAVVPDITTNTYRPGAFADHLTSFGGVFTSTCSTSNQMNVLCWLEAGVTGSFGTVIEPCNWPGKFPDAQLLTMAYFRGKTLLEAIWESVAMPGQGIIVGEPLARPFGTRVTTHSDHVTIETTELTSSQYVLEGAPDESGPWSTIGDSIAIKAPTRYVVDVPFGPAFLRFRKQ